MDGRLYGDRLHRWSDMAATMIKTLVMKVNWI